MQSEKDQTHQSCVVKETQPRLPTTTTNTTMPSFRGLKRSMSCTDLISMLSSISALKELCAAFDEQEFSSDNLLRSNKPQRMSPLCVSEDDKHCNPATAALEAALALNAFDDDASPFENGGIDSSLALFSLNEYCLEGVTQCAPCE
jgi:hypothetical protein